MNHPIRRYAFGISNEPLFFSAFMGVVSFFGFMFYMMLARQTQPIRWDRRALSAFVWTGIFETLSILFIMTALSVGRVVVVAPLAATYPVWALAGAKLFLRDVEKIGWKTIIGIVSVVAGTAAIHFGR